MNKRETRYDKQTPQERRKGDAALSDFADYVQKQQAHRRPPTQTADTDSAYGTRSSTITDDHAELDIIDSLGLAEESTQVRLKHLLLDSGPDSDESITLLTGYLNGRLEEGHGETLFDLGLEDSGDAMGFELKDWEFALARLKDTAKGLNADIRVLATRGVGGEEEINGVQERKGKDRGVHGKLMIRRKPDSVDDVIETRIAVVGNGKA
ncbi:MAG: hypothetical protein M1820_003235 [Bogoriella megaspora]|nr:MAG: hypothetical protein M1820_003235 [Bogoriella megaspora]